MSTPRKAPTQTTAKADTNKAEETAVTKSTDLALAGEGGDKEGNGEAKVLTGKDVPDSVENYTHPAGKTIDEIVAEKVAEALKALPTAGVSNIQVEDGHVVGINSKESSDVAELQEKEIKKVKIKFIKPHSFYVNTEQNNAKEGDVLMVERHIANKLVGRHIAYILG